MENTLEFLQPSASVNDVAIVAKRRGATISDYLKDRMVEALMSDISTDVLRHYDFSSEEQIHQALEKLKDLSDEFILTIAQFKFDSNRSDLVHELREANTEGALTTMQREVLETVADQENDISIVKAIARLEAQRRGLKLTNHSAEE